MNKRILIIDDDLEILDDYRQILAGDRLKTDCNLAGIADNLGLEPSQYAFAETESYELATSSSGEEGVRMVERAMEEERPFAVIFCDMRMTGGIDGLETGKRVRKLDKQVEMVLVTGYSDHERRNIIKELGAPEKLLYIKKPFDPDEIRQLALKLTKSWQMERDLKNALKKAKAADKAKSDFLNVVTHEFKTPLTGILGSVETLKIAVEKNSVHKYGKFLEMIERSALRLTEMVDDVLLFSRAQSHKIKLHPETFDLKEFLDLLVSEEVLPLLHGKKLDFSVNAPRISIYADRKKLRHIILNLLSNAIKFTSSGGISINCHKNVDGQINFSIYDTGCGIPKDNTNKIFEEFYQVDRNNSEQQGTGLGLAIVKKYVNLHGGSIDVESGKGVGSTFRFTISEPAIKNRLTAENVPAEPVRS